MDNLFLNWHLLPFKLLLLLGFSIIPVSAILCFLRTGRAPIYPYMNWSHLNNFEKLLLKIGLISGFVGIIGLAAVSHFYGYYYLNNGVPTWTK
jgi:hypothetical protein